MYERIGGFRVTRGTLPAGDLGTRKTLDVMRRLALEGSRDLEVREAAIDIVRRARIRGHDHLGELGALFRFVRDEVRFTDDVLGVETLQGPRASLHYMAGDCDDRAVLLASLARSIGIPANLRFRAIGVDPRRPQRFSHVYVVANLGGRMIPLDPTYPDNRMGWEHPRPYRTTDVAL